MEVSQHHDNDHPITSIDDNNNQNDKKIMKKHELINKYFNKINTGGYHCKLCEGTKNSKQVSSNVLISDRNNHATIAYELKYLIF